MKISTSVLDSKDRMLSVIQLNQTKTSYIHIDVMDGKFVPNVQFMDWKEISNLSKISKCPLDVHLMMDNPSIYIEKLKDLNILYITVHLELGRNLKEIFSHIKSFKYKVGLSIKPGTKIEEIEPYLDDIDLVLLMSVEPGLGGQKFMESTISRVLLLKKLIGNRDILIEVDGGINDTNINLLKDIDIAVVGSYIINSDDYSKKIDELLTK